MRNATADTITDLVLARFGSAESSRARQVSEALVRHLHAFVKEIRPSQAEWEAGIDFLTRTGQMCVGGRQEFVLMSDTLGVSMLVDALANDFPPEATQSTVLGPFHVPDLPEAVLGADISGGVPGAPLLVEGTVTDPAGAPCAGAWVDTWHSDGVGFYDVQMPEPPAEAAMRARLKTDERGRFWFRSIVPAHYPVPTDGPVGEMLRLQGRHPFRPAHVHFLIEAPGFRKLVTHVFLEGSEYLDSDAVFGVKDSLIRALETPDGATTPGGNPVGDAKHILRYDFVLTPESAVAGQAD